MTTTTTPKGDTPTTTQPVNPALARILARADLLARTTTGKGRKHPKPCSCGCGGTTAGGDWLPGHDAKALSRALAARRAGLAG